MGPRGKPQLPTGSDVRQLKLSLGLHFDGKGKISGNTQHGPLGPPPLASKLDLQTPGRSGIPPLAPTPHNRGVGMERLGREERGTCQAWALGWPRSAELMLPTSLER